MSMKALARVLLALIALPAQAAVAVPEKAASREQIIDGYADLALAEYGDSLTLAHALRAATDALLAAPAEDTLEGARAAWLAARVPYMQTEVYRFGNTIVDEWEGRVNAWPLDEGLIDYVAESYGADSDENVFYTANVIATEVLAFGDSEVDAKAITRALIRSLHEVDAVEANVATGYHAIEFLLWGQDLNYTRAGRGERPSSDYSLDECSGGNCPRRRAYLAVLVDLLVDDLEEMVGNWRAEGAARTALRRGRPETGLSVIVTGMGSLSYGELAGERMKLGLLLHDPEEEHDCFSDNTHNSHYYDAVGIRNVYVGAYRRSDGSLLQVPSLGEHVAAHSPTLDAEIRARLDETIVRMQALRDKAESGMAYDQMIAEGNAEGNALVQAAIDALLAQTKAIEKVVRALELSNLEFESSDSLDASNTGMQ